MTLYYERPRLYYGLWMGLLLGIVATIVAVGVTQSKAWDKDYAAPAPPTEDTARRLGLFR